MPTTHLHYLPTKGGVFFDQLIRTRFAPFGLILCTELYEVLRHVLTPKWRHSLSFLSRLFQALMALEPPRGGAGHRATPCLDAEVASLLHREEGLIFCQ